MLLFSFIEFSAFIVILLLRSWSLFLSNGTAKLFDPSFLYKSLSSKFPRPQRIQGSAGWSSGLLKLTPCLL